MSITKNMGLVREVEKHLRGGIEKKVILAQPGTRFEKLGTIFSRVTGLVKSGVMPTSDLPIWYSVYKAFPPKYEPRFDRPPMDNIKIKDIYYPEDKLRAAIKKFENISLNRIERLETQSLVSEFLERRTTSSNDEALIKELVDRHNSKTAKSKPIDEVEGFFKDLK